MMFENYFVTVIAMSLSFAALAIYDAVTPATMTTEVDGREWTCQYTRLTGRVLDCEKVPVKRDEFGQRIDND